MNSKCKERIMYSVKELSMNKGQLLRQLDIAIQRINIPFGGYHSEIEFTLGDTVYKIDFPKEMQDD